MSQPNGYYESDGNASFLRAARAGNLDKVLEYLKGSTDINTSNANGLNALHLASKEGHVHVVTELLKRGANVDAATKKGNTALHIASLAGQLDVAKTLVQNNAKVNAQSQNGFTPLYMAAQECHAEMVRLLLNHGASQVLTTEDGFTPLAVALQQGHDKVVTVLLENDTRGKVRLPALHIAAKKDDTKAAALLLQNEHNADVTSKSGGLVNDTTKSGFTPLHIASHYGNVNVATLLIERGADVNFKARNGICPLHVAAKWGKLQLLNLLVDSGAAVDGRTRDGLTPLHCAARSGHEACVDVLLEKGAPLAAKTRNGLMPLHMAAQGDHVDCGRLLLLKKAPVDEVTVDYLTPLHVAAHCGNVRMAKLLLDSKCEPNARALNGFTPLHIACKKNRIKVVELLLKYGASIEATTESGLTPLHVASFMGHMNIVMCLIQNGANPDFQTVRGETALHLAARANQTDIIRILLRNNAQVDARAREQQTPLHIAARLGHVENVLLLLQHGASADALTKDLYTPLHIAAKEGQDEVAGVLIENGASHNLTTKKGFTPLHIAAKYGNIKVGRLLLQKGANSDVQGKNGLTPLHVATHYNHVNVAMLLLDRGASPHCSAKNGYTPLHIAAKKNQMDIATSLLKYGAKTNAESKNGFMPLHLAAQEGHKQMVTLLLENGADANCRAKNLLTPMHLAAQEDREAVAMILEAHNAELDPATKAGYTPLHTASHFGQLNMVRYLTRLGSNVNATTKMGYTPLHQAAQQGHLLVCKELLKNGASPNAVTNNGQTALSIADRLGYLSVVDTLREVTSVSAATTTLPEGEKLQIQSPEMLQETFLTDSEDEGESLETPSATIERLRKQRDRQRAHNHAGPAQGNYSLNSQDNSFDTYEGSSDFLDRRSRLSRDEDVFDEGGTVPLRKKRRKDRLHTVDDFSRMMNSSNQQLEKEMEYGGRMLSESTMDRGDSMLRPYSKSQDTISMGISMSEDNILGDQYTYLQSDDMKYMHDDSIQSQKGYSEEFLSSTPAPGTESAFFSLNDSSQQSIPFNLMDEHESQEKFESSTVGQVHAVADMRGGPYTQYGHDNTYAMTNTQLNAYEPDNIMEQTPPVFSGKLKWKSFLISFMVDARGGAMRGCRHQGVRIIIPPRKATMPTRVTCRLVKKEKLLHPPPLMEGEGLASRLLEMGPTGTSFLGPVVIEVPHFASLRGKEREVIIMRSENGETWREHTTEATEEAVQAALGGSFEDLESAEDLYNKRITRILTTDFPQYFALITRVREETNHIGGEGGTISSTVIPQVQAVFPEGALTKKIKVGLQAQQIPSDQVAKLLGNRVAVSPIVTVEPRRRKFHKPITLTIPLPKASQKGMINQYAGDTPTLRLLCSITGGTSPAQWEDLTGTTPLTFHKDCVSFTTAVSARFWLMDCQNINEAAKIATELYRESICVPYMAKFVIFAKRHDPQEARLRCFCMTDDKMDKTLESQEHYNKVAESRDVEVLEGKSAWIEMAGNLVPVTKSGDQLHLPFRAFRENRLPFNTRVRDTNAENVARVAFMRDPKQQRGEAPQTPICSLNIELPDFVKGEDSEYDGEAAEELRLKYKLLRGEVITDHITKADLRLSDIADTLQGDWVILAQHLQITDQEVIEIKKKYTTLSDQCLAMLILWKKKFGDEATGNSLEQALKDINRDDVVRKTMYNLEAVTDAQERAFAKMQIEQSAGFDDLKDELGPSRNSTMERNQSLNLQLEDTDLMKESESAGEDSPSSPSSVLENRSFKKGPTGEDEFVADYDRERQVKPRAKADDEEQKKQDAYLALIAHMGDMPEGLVDDTDSNLPGGALVDEDRFEPTQHQRDQYEDFLSKVEHLDDEAPAPSMDDQMSISSDEAKGHASPDYDQVAARLNDQVVPDSSTQTLSAPYEQDYAAPDSLQFQETPESCKSMPSEPSQESLASPEEEIEETVETLPDGTLIQKRIVTKGKSMTTYTSVVPQEPETITTVVPQEPESITTAPAAQDDRPDEIEETEDTLPDGSMVLTKVIRTDDTVYKQTKTIYPDGEVETANEVRPRTPDSDVSDADAPHEATPLQSSSVEQHPDPRAHVSDFVDYEPDSFEPSVEFEQPSHFFTSEPEHHGIGSTQPVDYEEFSDLNSSTEQPDLGNIKIQTEVIKGEPKVETDTQEYEEELEDGTIVKRRITKTKTTQDITTRIRAEGYGVDDLATVPGLNDDELANGSTIEGEPETDTNVEEYEDMLDDGTLVKRKVIKTRTTQSTMTKTVSDSSDTEFQNENAADGEAVPEGADGHGDSTQ